LNKPAQARGTIQARGAVWAASDMHLSEASPATNRAFIDFLDQAALRSDYLFLPGDIFDAWIGDDYALKSPPPWLLPILDALLRASQHTRLYIGRGNRDFLMGDALARRIGAQLLPDAVRLETDAGSVLLSHGDEYCTADVAYQRFRRRVRNPLLQKMYLSLGLGIRRSIADWARRRSQKQNACKPMAIMDVHPEAINKALRQSDCRIMVHGHTHRPAIHSLTIDGQDRLRIVLPDWDFDHASRPRGGWLIIDADGARLHQIPDCQDV